MVGAGGGGIDPVIGGDDQACRRGRANHDARQGGVDRRQPSSEPVNVVPVPPHHVEVHQVGEEQAFLEPPALRAVLQKVPHQSQVLVIGGHVDLLGHSPADEHLADLAQRQHRYARARAAGPGTWETEVPGRSRAGPWCG